MVVFLPQPSMLRLIVTDVVTEKESLGTMLLSLTDEKTVGHPGVKTLFSMRKRLEHSHNVSRILARTMCVEAGDRPWTGRYLLIDSCTHHAGHISGMTSRNPRTRMPGMTLMLLSCDSQRHNATDCPVTVADALVNHASQRHRTVLSDHTLAVGVS